MTRPLHVALLAAVVATLVPATVAQARTDRAAARLGAAWLARAVHGGADGQAADTLVALRAAGPQGSDGARRARELRKGAGQYARTAGSTAKVILGLAASARGNPRCAGRLDLLRRLNGFGRRGRYGSSIFDQTLGMMAAHALRAGPSRNAVAVLLRARGRGGWNFNVTRSGGRPDDVTSTAMAILAARAVGVSSRNGTLRAGLRWLRAQRAPSGGFALGRRDRTEANSTALALEAARAMGSADGRARRALRSLQRSGGAFQYTRDDAGSRVLASVDAVVALAGRRLPVAVARRRSGGC
jgi:hypothetical protein